MSLKFNMSALKKGLDLFDDKFNVAIKMYVDSSTKKIENYAKKHRPWTDRTAQARQRLKSSYKIMPFGYRIQLQHGVSYGKYLEATNNRDWKTEDGDGKNQLTGLQAEFAFERKYAIISPTIRAKSPEVLKGLQNLFDRM